MLKHATLVSLLCTGCFLSPNETNLGSLADSGLDAGPIVDIGTGRLCTEVSDCGSTPYLQCSALWGSSTFPDGLCTQLCFPSTTEAQYTCESGATCVPRGRIDGINDSSGLCLRLCQTSNDCRAGYTCQALGASNETVCSTSPGAGADDAGIARVAPVNPLTAASCTDIGNLPTASCDGGPCLMLHRAGQPPLPILSTASLGADRFYAIVGTSDDWLLFSTSRDALARDADSLWAVPALGGSPQRISQLTGGEYFTSIGLVSWSANNMFWFAPEIGNQGIFQRQTMYMGTTSPSGGGVTPAYPDVEPIVSGVAERDTFVAVHSDGVYDYYPAGRSRIVENSAPNAITALAADASYVWLAECGPVGSAMCSVYRVARRGSPEKRLLFDVATPSIDSMVLIGADLYLLELRRLWRVPSAGGSAEVVYRARTFNGVDVPELLTSSLREVNGKLVFGQMCDFDTDAPKYGTVELDLAGRTARWLNLDPAYPYFPYVASWSGLGSTAPMANAHGLYRWNSP